MKLLFTIEKGKKRPIGYVSPGGYKKTSKGWVKVSGGTHKGKSIKETLRSNRYYNNYDLARKGSYIVSFNAASGYYPSAVSIFKKGYRFKSGHEFPGGGRVEEGQIVFSLLGGKKERDEAFKNALSLIPKSVKMVKSPLSKMSYIQQDDLDYALNNKREG